MEKVKLTREQADAIEKYKEVVYGTFDFLHDLASEHYIDFDLSDEEKEREAIKLMRAFVTGEYEVEPEFKVGDWVVYKHDNTIWEIIGELYGGKVHYNITRNGKHKRSVHKDHIRLATPEEIAAEKERRWWKKHNRRVWELKKGDLLKDPLGEIEEVRKIKNNGYDLGIYNVYRTLNCIKKRYSVACFVEDRKDV